MLLAGREQLIITFIFLFVLHDFYTFSHTSAKRLKIRSAENLHPENRGTENLRVENLHPENPYSGRYHQALKSPENGENYAIFASSNTTNQFP